MRRRKPPKVRVKDGQLKVAWGTDEDGNVGLVICNGPGVPRADGWMILGAFWHDRRRVTLDESLVFDPSFIKELEERGYDLKTLRFTIEKKPAD